MKNLFNKSVMILISCAMLLSCSSGKISLRDMGMKGVQMAYKPKAGSTFEYQVSSSSEAAMGVMGQDQGGTSTSEALMKFRVTNIKDNAVNYNLSYESVNIQTTIPGSPDPNPYEDKLLQSNIGIETDQYGNVTNLSGVDELKKMTFGQNIESELRGLFVVFSPKTIKIGDSWLRDDTETIIGGPLKIEVKSNSTYTFAGVETHKERECYKFNSETKSVLTGAGEQGGMDLEYEGNGSSSGEIYFDYLRGMVVAGTSSMTIESVISVPSQGMDIPRTDIQTTKIELVE